MSRPLPGGSAAPDEAGLVPLLLVMSFVTGAVDAVSILRLGHVFMANMTGNVVFLGFAIAGAKGFSAWVSLVALGSFLCGAAVVGRRFRSVHDRRRALGQVAAAEALLFAASSVVAMLTSGSAGRYAIAVMLGTGMGAQNGIAARLAVKNLTTTVLTMTLTGLAGDRSDVGQPGSQTWRRLAAVAGSCWERSSARSSSCIAPPPWRSGSQPRSSSVSPRSPCSAPDLDPNPVPESHKGVRAVLGFQEGPTPLSRWGAALPVSAIPSGYSLETKLLPTAANAGTTHPVRIFAPGPARQGSSCPRSV